MAKLKYRNDIAPQIIEEARNRIFNSFIEKGYIGNTELVPIKSIEDCSIEICSSISMKMTGYFMKTKPDEVNIYAPIYSSLLSVLVGMALTNEWAKGNKEIPENIYDEMIDFARYAFNKSHAAAYAYVAYQTAYLKTHYGPEYMAASMTSKMGKTEDIVTIVQECRRMNIEVLPPDINSSLGVFSANEKGQVVYGLAGIRNVGLPVIEDVVAEREAHGPYTSLFDLCKRVGDYQAAQPEKRPPLNRKTIESLIMAGAFDKMSPTTPNRPTLLASVEKAIEVANRHRKEQDAGQTSLFDMFGGGATEEVHMDETYEDAQPWGLMELLNKERDVLGLYLSAHPLDECRPELRGFTTNSLAESELNEIVEQNPKSIVCVGGIITKLRSFQSKKDETKTMGSGTLQDFQGEISIFFPPDSWERCRDHFGEDDRVIVKGKLTPQNQDPSALQIIVDKAFSMDEVRTRLVNFIHVNVSSMELVDEKMTAILERMEMAQALPGEHAAEVVFHVETLSGHIHTLKAQVFKIAYTPDFFEWLQKEFGPSNVWVSALEFVITNACEGKTTKHTALSAIPTFLFSSNSLTYDTTNGRAHFIVGSSFDLTRYISPNGGNRLVNCYDQAHGVAFLGATLGIDSTISVMDPFGYLNPVPIVGIGICNNPFFSSPDATVRNQYCDENDSDREYFIRHCFVLRGGFVFDACAGPEIGTNTLASYVSTVVDVSTTNEQEQVYYDNTTWPPTLKTLQFGNTSNCGPISFTLKVK